MGGPADREPVRYRATATGVAVDTSSRTWGGSTLILARVADFYRVQIPQVASGVLVDLGAGDSPLRPFYEPLVDVAWSIDWPSSVHDTEIQVAADITLGVPVASGSVDTVLVSDVLEHVTDPTALVVEAHRVLARGGVLVGSTPFAYWLHEEPHDHWRFTEHGLRHLLTSAGFVDVEVTVVAGGFDVLVDIITKLLGKVPKVGSALARLVALSWLRVSRLGVISRGNRGFARKLPLEYGWVARSPTGGG